MLIQHIGFRLATNGINSRNAMRFANLVKTLLPGAIRQVLTDNGSEFAGAFDEYAKQQGLLYLPALPEDERLLRALQAHRARGIRGLPGKSDDLRGFNDRLLAYLQRYNGERPHRGLSCLGPCQAIARQIPDLSSMW